MDNPEKVASVLARMLPHHISWLKSRPHRTMGWLAEMLRCGFDIHHLDGNHDNNEPGNLVLIEHTDHIRLHNGGAYTLGRLTPSGRRRKRRKRVEAAIAAREAACRLWNERRLKHAV